MKRVHQGRLADTGFTGDENDLPPTPKGSAQRVMQFGQSGVPAHHLLCRLSQVLHPNSYIVTHRRHELVSALGKGFNEFRFVVPVT